MAQDPVTLALDDVDESARAVHFSGKLLRLRVRGENLRPEEPAVVQERGAPHVQPGGADAVALRRALGSLPVLAAQVLRRELGRLELDARFEVFEDMRVESGRKRDDRNVVMRLLEPLGGPRMASTREVEAAP